MEAGKLVLKLARVYSESTADGLAHVPALDVVVGEPEVPYVIARKQTAAAALAHGKLRLCAGVEPDGAFTEAAVDRLHAATFRGGLLNDWYRPHTLLDTAGVASGTEKPANYPMQGTSGIWSCGPIPYYLSCAAVMAKPHFYNRWSYRRGRRGFLWSPLAPMTKKGDAALTPLHANWTFALDKAADLGALDCLSVNAAGAAGGGVNGKVQWRSQISEAECMMRLGGTGVVVEPACGPWSGCDPTFREYLPGPTGQWEATGIGEGWGEEPETPGYAFEGHGGFLKVPPPKERYLVVPEHDLCHAGFVYELVVPPFRHEGKVYDQLTPVHGICGVVNAKAFARDPGLAEQRAAELLRIDKANQGTWHFETGGYIRVSMLSSSAATGTTAVYVDGGGGGDFSAHLAAQHVKFCAIREKKAGNAVACRTPAFTLCKNVWEVTAAYLLHQLGTAHIHAGKVVADPTGLAGNGGLTNWGKLRTVEAADGTPIQSTQDYLTHRKAKDIRRIAPEHLFACEEDAGWTVDMPELLEAIGLVNGDGQLNALVTAIKKVGGLRPSQFNGVQWATLDGFDRIGVGGAAPAPDAPAAAVSQVSHQAGTAGFAGTLTSPTVPFGYTVTDGAAGKRAAPASDGAAGKRARLPAAPASDGAAGAGGSEISWSEFLTQEEEGVRDAPSTWFGGDSDATGSDSDSDDWSTADEDEGEDGSDEENDPLAIRHFETGETDEDEDEDEDEDGYKNDTDDDEVMVRCDEWSEILEWTRKELEKEAAAEEAKGKLTGFVALHVVSRIAGQAETPTTNSAARRA